MSRRGAQPWTERGHAAPAPGLEYEPGVEIGEYRIERTLGIGGMGTVYEAVHLVIEKRVALKVLHHELCKCELAITRFIQEARAVNRIAHPNIVDVFGFGSTEDGRAFLAMELLTGESLADRLARPPSVPLDEASHILVEITHALEAAHAAGIIHRDLKPDNVFLVASRKGFPNVKLLDFGVAKLMVEDNDPKRFAATQPGMVVGTPRYIAPEQAQGFPTDGRADIYALGVLGFEMLTGRPPFTGTNAIDVVAKHVALQPPTPSDFNVELPPVADQVIGDMLEKEPENRPTFARIRELVEHLPLAARSERAAEVAVRRNQETAVIDLAAIQGAVTLEPGNDARSPTRRARWLFLPLGLGVLAVGVKLATSAADSDDVDRPRSVDGRPIITGSGEAVTDVAPRITAPAPPPETQPSIRRPVTSDLKPPFKVAHPTRPLPPKKPQPSVTKVDVPVPNPPIEVKPPPTPTPTAPPNPNPTPKPVEHKPREDDDALRDPFAKKR